MPDDATVAVVGGGLSGLALGWRLRQRGREAVVLEAAPRPGGVAGTVVRDGYLVETGPNGFLDHREHILRLCRDLGLEAELQRANPASAARFLFRGERLERLPATPGEFLRSRVLSLRGRMRFVLERFLGKAGPADESVRAFGVRHFGAEAADTLFDAVVTGIYAGDAERLSFPACFPRLAALEREHGSLLKAQVALAKARRKAAPAASAAGGMLTAPRGGMGRIVARLAEELGPALRCGARVEGLSRAGGGWALRLANGETLRANSVALTIPGPQQADLLRPLDTELAAEIAAIPYAGAAVVALGFRVGPAAPAPQGFGYLAPERLGRPVLGIIFSSSIFPDQAPPGCFQVRAILGGGRRADVLDRDDRGLIELVRDDLRTACGISAAPEFSLAQRWRQGIPQYWVGHRERLARIDRRAADLPGLVLAGTAFRGVAVDDCAREAERLAGVPAPRRIQ